MILLGVDATILWFCRLESHMLEVTTEESCLEKMTKPLTGGAHLNFLTFSLSLGKLLLLQLDEKKESMPEGLQNDRKMLLGSSLISTSSMILGLALPVAPYMGTHSHVSWPIEEERWSSSIPSENPEAHPGMD